MRKVALLLLILGLVYACSENRTGRSLLDVPRSTSIRLAPRFSIEGAAQLDPITRARLTAKKVGTNEVVATADTTIDPNANEWDLNLDVPAAAGQVVVLIELLNTAGGIEWSGLTSPINVVPGQTSTPTPVTLFQGPPDNLTVNGVAVSPHTATVTEGGTVPLTAVVSGGGPAARAVFNSLDPQIATVNGNDGLVNTLRNGTARIVAAAGPRRDTAVITVLQRVNNVVLTPDTQRIGSIGGEAVFVARVVDPRGGDIAGAQQWFGAQTTQRSPSTFRMVVSARSPTVSRRFSRPARVTLRYVRLALWLSRSVRLALQ
jgi:hypothetical protein